VRAEGRSVCVVEKEPVLARHQSTHNSGVLHAGLQYRPGSEKARLARRGIRRMTEFCRQHGIAHEICGKLVMAGDADELPRLDALLERGRRNGLEGLRRVLPEEAAEIEPHVRCLGAIVVPEEGIVDFAGVCFALEGELRSGGCEIVTGAEVRGLVRETDRWRVLTPAGEVEAKVIVNCAGLHSDRVARMAGAAPPAASSRSGVSTTASGPRPSISFATWSIPFRSRAFRFSASTSHDGSAAASMRAPTPSWPSPGRATT
jgi:L-2-hydroxyglutarate oxidase